jgi:DMSO reductase anchor subunit
MHPALSVIFFTTASGAGYGLLFLMGVLAAAGAVPAHRGLGLTGFAVALGLVTFGLLSSTFHLGHPERAWRALSQWRSSWLSREGVMAMLTYPPTLLFAVGWAGFADNYGPWALVGLVMAWAAAGTVFCTAMIYASLKPIHQWCNPWVVPGYLVLGVMSGGVLLNGLTVAFGLANPYVTGWVAFSLAVGLALKLGYWHFVAETDAISTPETATGLKVYGRVRLVDPPHTRANYLLREMGFQVARRHARQLRAVAIGGGFVLPFLLTVFTLVAPDGVAAALGGSLAVLACGAGLIAERWLFFAEAKHTVTLYYGAEAV